MTERPRTELPQLRAYGRELHGAMLAEERRAVRRRRRRRFAVAFVGASALVPTAIATRNVWAPDATSLDPRGPVSKSSPVIIQEGTTPEAPWRLSVYDGERGRCLQLELRTANAGNSAGCSSRVPAEADVEVQVAGGAEAGFVYGATSAQVRRVRVEVSGQDPRAVETRVPDADLLRRNGTKADFRTFVAVFPEPVDATRPFRVLAEDEDGAVVDSFVNGGG